MCCKQRILHAGVLCGHPYFFIMERYKMTKKTKENCDSIGFGLRLTFAIFLAALFVCVTITFLSDISNYSTILGPLFIALMVAMIASMQFVCVFKG